MTRSIKKDVTLIGFQLGTDYILYGNNAQKAAEALYLNTERNSRGCEMLLVTERMQPIYEARLVAAGYRLAILPCQ